MRQKNENSKGTKRICVISIRCRLPIYRGHLKKGKFTHVKPIYSGSIRPSDENSSGWPFLNQRAVHRDVILRQKLLLLGQCQHFEKNDSITFMFQQSVTVLGKHRVVPYPLFHRQAKQQVVAYLLHQLPLAAHRIEYLQQQCPNQFLRRNRIASAGSIDRIKQSIKPLNASLTNSKIPRSESSPGTKSSSLATMKRLSCIASDPRIPATSATIGIGYR